MEAVHHRRPERTEPLPEPERNRTGARNEPAGNEPEPEPVAGSRSRSGEAGSARPGGGTGRASAPVSVIDNQRHGIHRKKEAARANDYAGTRRGIRHQRRERDAWPRTLAAEKLPRKATAANCSALRSPPARCTSRQPSRATTKSPPRSQPRRPFLGHSGMAGGDDAQSAPSRPAAASVAPPGWRGRNSVATASRMVTTAGTASCATEPTVREVRAGDESR